MPSVDMILHSIPPCLLETPTQQGAHVKLLLDYGCQQDRKTLAEQMHWTSAEGFQQSVDVPRSMEPHR